MKDTIKNFFAKLDLIRLLTALTVMGTFFQITNALIYKTIPEANKEILIHLLGIVEGGVMTIVGYEFGAAKGQRNKGDGDDSNTMQITNDKEVRTALK